MIHSWLFRTQCGIRLTCGVLLIGLTALSGCSGSDQPELGLVTGRITLEGEPLRNVEVAFMPLEGRASYGETDEDGNYELNYIRDIQGAKVGTHNVLIRSGQVDKDQLTPVEVGPGANVIDIACQRVNRTKESSEPEPEI